MTQPTSPSRPRSSTSRCRTIPRVLHVQGAANYVDDIGEPAGTLHIAIGMADKACGKLKSLDLERGARGAGRRRGSDGG